MSKQKFPKPLHFLENGFKLIPKSVSNLAKSSTLLLKKNVDAQSASLSIIALEECGKLFLLDSLLLLRDPKDDTFTKGSLSHKNKLFASGSCIALMELMSEFDPKNENPNEAKIFQIAIEIALKNLRQEFQAVKDRLPGADITRLDLIRQQGFYSHHENQQFKVPSVERKLALQLNKLASLFAKNLIFILLKKRDRQCPTSCLTHIQRCHYHYSIFVRHPYLLIHIGRFKVAELAVYAYVTRLVKDDEEEDGWANEPEEASVVYVNNKVGLVGLLGLLLLSSSSHRRRLAP